MLIEDGGGSGRHAQVNEDFRLRVEAVARASFTSASQDKESAFSTASDFISLVAATGVSAVYYHKNTSQGPQFLHQLHLSALATAKWKMIKNPTAGDILAGVAISPENLDTGSPGVLTADVRKGVDGSAVTDGVAWAQWLKNIGTSVLSFEGAVILQPGGSLALTCEPTADTDVSATLLWTTE